MAVCPITAAGKPPHLPPSPSGPGEGPPACGAASRGLPVHIEPGPWVHLARVPGEGCPAPLRRPPGMPLDYPWRLCPVLLGQEVGLWRASGRSRGGRGTCPTWHSGCLGPQPPHPSFFLPDLHGGRQAGRVMPGWSHGQEEPRAACRAQGNQRLSRGEAQKGSAWAEGAQVRVRGAQWQESCLHAPEGTPLGTPALCRGPASTSAALLCRPWKHDGTCSGGGGRAGPIPKRLVPGGLCGGWSLCEGTRQVGWGGKPLGHPFSAQGLRGRDPRSSWGVSEQAPPRSI